MAEYQWPSQLEDLIPRLDQKSGYLKEFPITAAINVHDSQNRLNVLSEAWGQEIIFITEKSFMVRGIGTKTFCMTICCVNLWAGSELLFCLHTVSYISSTIRRRGCYLELLPLQSRAVAARARAGRARVQRARRLLEQRRVLLAHRVHASGACIPYYLHITPSLYVLSLASSVSNKLTLRLTREFVRKL